MAGYVVDAGATISCPHGGRGTVMTRATRMRLGGNPPILADDVATIAGCAFNVAGAPSPCTRVQWVMPAMRMTVEGAAPVLSSSVGLCVNAAGAPQGTALVTGHQTRVRAQ